MTTSTGRLALRAVAATIAIPAGITALAAPAHAAPAADNAVSHAAQSGVGTRTGAVDDTARRASAALDTLTVQPKAAPPTAENFAKLRQCESGGNYKTNTGNGYYGAYQFDLATWQGLGYSGRPDQASPETQDQAAFKLQAQRGWSPWPACARKLGFL